MVLFRILEQTEVLQEIKQRFAEGYLEAKNKILASF
jgi:hypothetical protein